jgi:hypothetical protein
MKRLFGGSVVFAASLVLVSCSSDPTSDFRGTPTRIVADPSSIFLDQGTNLPVNVRLEDDQGDPLTADFEIAATGTGITVDRNEDFLGTTVGAPLGSEAQFVVFAGNTPVATSFTLTAGGLSLEIPVKVTPTSLVATFSNPAPAINEPVTITAEGFTFLPEAAISVGGKPALILSNDGASVTFLPVPGSTGPALVEGIAVNFLPTAPLSLETTTEISVPAFTGTESPATAPAIPVPAAGGSVLIYDGGVFAGADITGDGGVGAQYYTFTVTEAGDYHFVTDWVGDDTDIDAIVCFDAACSDGAFAGTGVTHPEDGTLTLAPGTYYFVSVLFAGPPVPFNVTISR